MARRSARALAHMQESGLTMKHILTDAAIHIEDPHSWMALPVRGLTDRISPAVFEALATIAGGEEVPPFDP